MKDDLLLRARSDLRSAKFGINTGDEYDLCIAAYHIQQAAEKAVKACLKNLGISYTKTHNIRELLRLLPDSQTFFSDDILNMLEDIAPTLREWESNTRYVEGYLVSRRQVIRYFDFVEKILSDVENTIEDMSLHIHKDTRVSDIIANSKPMSLKFR